MSKHGQLPQLTGIRAIAFGMVFLFHACLPGHFLWSGVDLFFVLSGYLITGILLAQKKSDGYYRIFYTRRFLRIFPPFYIVLILSILVLEQVSGAQALSIALFMANVYMPFVDLAHVPESHNALGPYWTLALEEQFYLIWPMVVFKLRPKHLLWTCVLLILMAPILRALTFVYLFHTGITNYQAIFMFSWNRMDLLAAGSAIAICQHLTLFDSKTLANWGMAMAIGGFTFILMVGAVIPGFHLNDHSLIFSVLGFSVSCCMMSGVVLYLANTSDSLIVKLLSLKPVVYLGTISYTMYLLHAAVLSVLEHKFGILFGWSLAGSAFVITFLIASLSWHTLERPIKNLKESPFFMKK